MFGVDLKKIGSHTRTKITPKLPPPRPSINIITHLVAFLNIVSGHIQKNMWYLQQYTVIIPRGGGGGEVL